MPPEFDLLLLSILVAFPAIPSLVNLLGVNGDGITQQRAREHATNALLSLAYDDKENLQQITQLLIELLTSSKVTESESDELHKRAVRSLWILVQENSNSHEVIAKAGHPEQLVQLLASGAPDAKDYAIWSLSLAVNANNQVVVADAGGAQHLIDKLRDDRPAIQERAAAALARLSRDNAEIILSVTSAGGVEPLIDLIVRAAQTRAVNLSSADGPVASGGELTEAVPLAHESVRNRDFIAAVIAGMETPEGALKNAVDALSNLAAEPLARDQIVGLGGIPPLVALLQGEGRDAKRFVAAALARLSTDHPATQLAVADAGAIRPLVLLTDPSDGDVAQEEAAGALFALAAHAQNRVRIATSGDGIGSLVNVLACNNPQARSHAEGALIRLSIEDSIRSQTIRTLVDMVSGSRDTAGMIGQEQAAATLSNLARESEANRNSIMEARGIPPLLELLDSQSAKARENAVGAITELCRKSKENQAAVAGAGGIPKLVNVLLGFSGAKIKDVSQVALCTLAASAIKELSKGNKRTQDAVAEDGAIPPLVLMLSAPNPEMQTEAAGALANLARNHVDNQLAIGRTGALGPMCSIIREGSDEAKYRAASAVWALASNNLSNKDTVAKLGGIDPLVGLLVTGSTEKSQQCVSGALCALAVKHAENRALIAKRLVGLLTSANTRAADRQVRVLMTCSSFAADASLNQTALSKAGALPPLITWLDSKEPAAQAKAAETVLCAIADNSITQNLCVDAGGIQALITLVRGLSKNPPKGTADTQSYVAPLFAARALWHLASQTDTQAAIVDHGAIKPFIAMLSAESEGIQELAATFLVRLTWLTPEVSITVAEKGGIPPLVRLLAQGSPGASQWACAVLGQLAMVSQNRDKIANANAIPKLILLLSSATVGTPETAARVISRLACADEDSVLVTSEPAVPSAQATGAKQQAPVAPKPGDQVPWHRRRDLIHANGGLIQLISMLDKEVHLAGKQLSVLKGVGTALAAKLLQVGVEEQAAAALADIIFDSPKMQSAVIEARGIPSLLAVIRDSSPVGQEHAARAIRNLCFKAIGGTDADMIANQSAIVECGTVVELVQLTKAGSQTAQEFAAAGLSELASGVIVERERKRKEEVKATIDGEAVFAKYDEDASGGIDAEELLKALDDIGLPVDLPEAQTLLKKYDLDHNGTLSVEEFLDIVATLSRGGQKTDSDTSASAQAELGRLRLISEAGGIPPLVGMLSSANGQAREIAAGALMHLALDPANQLAIAKANGILPLAAILEDGTPMAHMHAAEALLRLAVCSSETRLATAKNLVNLLGTGSPGAQRRASRVLSDLAAAKPDSPMVIVNAGAISPLLSALSNGSTKVKDEACNALCNLSINSPSTQLAIATGLAALLGMGTAEAQEHLAQLMLTLCKDKSNLAAISEARPIKGLVKQIREGGNDKAEEQAVAVLSHLTAASETDVDDLVASNGVKPLVSMLGTHSALARANASAVISHIAARSPQNQLMLIAESAIAPLLTLLASDNLPKTKAEAAGALMATADGQPEAQNMIAKTGSVRQLVLLLSEQDSHAQQMAAGAIAAISSGSPAVRDAVEKEAGVKKLVGLLYARYGDPVRAEAAKALAVLSGGHRENQTEIARADGIQLLVEMLGVNRTDNAKEAAAAALWALSASHHDNQSAIASAGGVERLVTMLAGGSGRAQRQATGALVALALDNGDNEASIAKLLVSLLGHEDKQSSAKAAARAVSSLARASGPMQQVLAKAGGINLLVELVDIRLGGRFADEGERRLQSARVQKEMASALWAMASDNEENQMAISEAGGIQKLVRLLKGHPEVYRDVAGAIWSLAATEANRQAITDYGGIEPLVGLLSSSVSGAQETVAGSLCTLAETPDNRVKIADAGGIDPLVALFNTGTEESKAQSSSALKKLSLDNYNNQLAIALSLVAMLSKGSAIAREYVTELLKDLMYDPNTRSAIIKAGAVNELVTQLEHGSEKAMRMAASALALIAKRSSEHRVTVTRELVKLLGSQNITVRQRASEALAEMAEDEKDGVVKKKATSAGSALPLVSLLRDGLQDERIEAQEYALRSLSSIEDMSARADMVEAGAIELLVAALAGGRLPAAAEEHAAGCISGLAPLGENARIIREASGVKPLVRLLSEGKQGAKEHAAVAIAHLARQHAGLSVATRTVSKEIADAGGVSALIKWLHDPNLGSPDIAAHALAEIALDNSDTQAQVILEGALQPLVAMVGAWAQLAAQANAVPRPVSFRTSDLSKALKLATAAAGCLATLAKDNAPAQLAIAEGEGITPLLALLKSSEHKSQESATKALWHLAALEKNQWLIARAGGIQTLVGMLQSSGERTQQYTAAALESLAKDHVENQIALSKAGAIQPLVSLLASNSSETQQHSVGALIHLASHDEHSRNAVVKRLVLVLEQRSAGAQMKAVEALAVLAARSSANRTVITAAMAVEPLVGVLGDGRRVRQDTPQERAAAVLADLARLSENKVKIATAGGIPPLVEMLSSESAEAQAHAASALWQLAAVRSNQRAIADSATELLVKLLTTGTALAQKYAAGVLWHLVSLSDAKAAMVQAGAIPALTSALAAENAELRDYSAAVVSALARTQGGNKREIFRAGGIKPLVNLLCDQKLSTQRHAACALWGMADGKDGVYDKQIAEAGAIPDLIGMLQNDDPETRGFAAACLKCCCADESAKATILSVGGADPLVALLSSPNTWLRAQCVDMLKLLDVPFQEPDQHIPVSMPAGGAHAIPNQFQTSAVLKVRKTQDPNSEIVKTGLASGTVVHVMQKVNMPDEAVRALVQLPDQFKPLGWVTISKPDGKQNLAPVRGGLMRDAIELDYRDGSSGARPRKKPGIRGSSSSQPRPITPPRELTEDERAARMQALLAAAAARDNISRSVKLKYHFFSFQVAAKTGYLGH